MSFSASCVAAQQSTPEGSVSDLSSVIIAARDLPHSERVRVIEEGFMDLFALDAMLSRIVRGNAMTPNQRNRFGNGLRRILADNFADVTDQARDMSIQPNGPVRQLSSGEVAISVRFEGTALTERASQGALIFVRGADGLYRLLDAEFGGVSMVGIQEQAFDMIVGAAAGDMNVVVSVTEDTVRNLDMQQ